MPPARSAAVCWRSRLAIRRHSAAAVTSLPWMGLPPKDHPTAGKMRLGVITRAGDEALRRTLVVGATSVIKQVRNGKANASPWLRDLVARKPPKLAAVALANKVARIAWKLMVSGERYDAARAGIVSPIARIAPCSRRQGRCAPPAAVASRPPCRPSAR